VPKPLASVLSVCLCDRGGVEVDPVADLYAVAKREPLVRIRSYGGVKCSMSNSNARSRRDDPPNVLVVAVLKLHVKR
jgi:hypothetical protein